MQQNKNILIINDMPGYGKVALAAMLPILSHMGHNIYNLPTALVSNTLDYGKFTILDTTDYMKKSIAVWKELGFSFDCITTGFLASAEQVDIIRAFIESQRKEDLLVMTDPIMGDEGKLYNGVTEETVENMRRLIGVADVIVPNLTEAEFLTERYRGGPRPASGPGGGGRPAGLRAQIGGHHQRAGGGDRPPRGVGLLSPAGAVLHPALRLHQGPLSRHWRRVLCRPGRRAAGRDRPGAGGPEGH